MTRAEKNGYRLYDVRDRDYTYYRMWLSKKEVNILLNHSFKVKDCKSGLYVIPDCEFT